jgi:hypothetical protein
VAGDRTGDDVERRQRRAVAFVSNQRRLAVAAEPIAGVQSGPGGLQSAGSVTTKPSVTRAAHSRAPTAPARSAGRSTDAWYASRTAANAARRPVANRHLGACVNVKRHAG